jgi:hypothetical protein
MRDQMNGTTIAGRYRIVDTLGQGGLGTVFKALDMRVSRIVALKVLRSEFVSDSHLGSLIKECEVLASLSHPNIIKAYECAKTGDMVYIALEYVEGRSLAQILAEGKPLDLDAAVGIVRQVGTALDYAHRRNFVHRDVKPANILISEDGRVLLSDFGLAQPLGASGLTEFRTILGTPAYMSPEQATGKLLDARSDVYSLGVVLYQSLTGRFPFSGNSTGAILKNLVESDPPRPSTFNAIIDRGLEDTVLKALEKDPERRFSSMHLFVEALSLFEARLGTQEVLNLTNITKVSVDEAETEEIIYLDDEDTPDSSTLLTNLKDLVGGATTKDVLAGGGAATDLFRAARVLGRQVEATGSAGGTAKLGSTPLPLPALPAEATQVPRRLARLRRPAKTQRSLWIAASIITVLLGTILVLEATMRRYYLPFVVFTVGAMLFLTYRLVIARLRRDSVMTGDGPLEKVVHGRAGRQTHEERPDAEEDSTATAVGLPDRTGSRTSDIYGASESFSQFLAASPTTETTPHVTLSLSSAQIQLPEPSALAWLLVLNGGLRGRQFRLSDTFTIGRSSENDFSLIMDSSISRQHARIALEDSRFYIYDLGSKRGTTVNGESVERKELRDRDEIRIGAHALLFISAVSSADLTLEAKRRLQDFDTLWEELARSVRHD